MKKSIIAAAISAIAVLAAPAVQAELAVSVNDNKWVLNDGVASVPTTINPDTIAIIDLNANPPKLLAEIEAGASVIGPPTSVAITPDEKLALATVAMKIDPQDATKLVPDNRVLVLDLTAMPPKVIATLETGLAPAGISINKAGNLALVANRSEGTISVLKIEGKTVSIMNKVEIGAATTGTSHVTISPDGRTALVSRDNDHKISVLEIDGYKVSYNKRDIYAGYRPYTIGISPRGDIAISGNNGVQNGDVDTLSIIDMSVKPQRVVDVVPVGVNPEGIFFSPDGSLLAATMINGSNRLPDSPWFNKTAKLLLFKVDGKKLTKVADLDIGSWIQGVAFSADNSKLVLQNMKHKELITLSWDGKVLKQTGTIALKAGPAGIRTAAMSR